MRNVGSSSNETIRPSPNFISMLPSVQVGDKPDSEMLTNENDDEEANGGALAQQSAILVRGNYISAKLEIVIDNIHHPF